MKVVSIEGLLADYVMQNEIDFMIRGVRSHTDFDSEFTQSIINHKICSRDTVFLVASEGKVHISSSLIRELSMYNQKLEGFVPEEIENEVYSHLFKHYNKV